MRSTVPLELGERYFIFPPSSARSVFRDASRAVEFTGSSSHQSDIPWLSLMGVGGKVGLLDPKVSSSPPYNSLLFSS